MDFHLHLNLAGADIGRGPLVILGLRLDLAAHSTESWLLRRAKNDELFEQIGL